MCTSIKIHDALQLKVCLPSCRLVLACICVGILLVFLGLWVFFIGKAFATIRQQNYSEYRLANISVRIQASC